MGQAHAVGGLRLAAVNALDAGAEDLADVGARVERQRQAARKERSVLLAEGARRFAGQQEAAVGMDQRRHQRKVHQQLSLIHI